MQAKRYYRYASIRDDILRKLRLKAPPNVTSRRLPAIPQLQSIIEEMCQQRGASCAGTLSGDREATSSRPADDSTQANDDDDDDVRATTMKILLFPVARNSSIRYFTIATDCIFTANSRLCICPHADRQYSKCTTVRRSLTSKRTQQFISETSLSTQSIALIMTRKHKQTRENTQKMPKSNPQINKKKHKKTWA